MSKRSSPSPDLWSNLLDCFSDEKPAIIKRPLTTTEELFEALVKMSEAARKDPDDSDLRLFIEKRIPAGGFL